MMMNGWTIDEIAIARAADDAALARTAPERPPGHEPVGSAPPAAARGPQAQVSLRGVSKRFGGVVALEDTSLDVAKGEILGVIGRSGAGKSTLIRLLNGLERPDRGQVLVEGKDIARLGERDLAARRRRIGMIFQHFNLLSAKTVAANVALPLAIAGVDRTRRARRVAELLALVGLEDKADAYPAMLSGGQKQRVGIARALAAEPTLLLSDEATSALDPETTEQILALLADINRRLNLTIVLITHEMQVVRAIADRVVVLDRGRVVEEGPVWRVLAAPRAPLTRGLVEGLHPPLPRHIGDRLHPDPFVGALAVLRIDFLGDSARDPIIADLVAATGLRPSILHGTVDHIQGQAVGHLVITFPAIGEALERVTGHLGPRVASLKLLGYVERTH